MPADPSNIHQLRERLRALGYLDARVDRYVLATAASGAGRTRFALAAGARVGVIAGALLGVSAAVALAARAPGLISGRRDAAILGLALSLVFALISAAAVSAAVLAASWYAGRTPHLTPRRARAAATTAGVAVALAAAAYLALWWDAAASVLTSMSAGWNAAALAIAAAIALLLAHAVSVVVLAALARAGRASDIAAGGLLSSRVFLAGFGVLLFAGSAALLGMRDAPASPAPLTVVASGFALRVVAVDGFDTELSARLQAAGALPALSRLLEGARIPLTPDRGAAPDPARDWTTIATGQPAERHGITALEARRAIGMQGRLPAAGGAVIRTLLYASDLLRLTAPAIATGEQRRDPAFWEVASAAGLHTAVVNWWATWPAPSGDDIVITDRAVLRLDAGGALDAEIAPAALYDMLRPEWPAMRADAAARAETAFQAVADPELRRVMLRSAELDLIIGALARRVSGPVLDLVVVYLPGLDIAQHSLLQSAGTRSVSAMAERISALEQYYRFLDGLIAEIMPASARHLDGVILWPGRVANQQGVLALAGAAIRPGSAAGEGGREPGAAATLLYLLGLPIAEDLHSSVVAGAIDPAFLGAHQVRRVPDYGAVALGESARTGQPLDAEALERLRSLGYIR